MPGGCGCVAGSAAPAGVPGEGFGDGGGLRAGFGRAPPSDFSLDDRPLRIDFYGWKLSLPPDLQKVNHQGEVLREDIGQMVHWPLLDDEPVPFSPRFIEYAAPDAPRATFKVRGHTRSYFVPNVHGVLLAHPTSDGDGRSRWFVRNPLSRYQSNWLWEILLRQVHTDPHGLAA